MSEFLKRHTSAELTELMALALLQAEPPQNSPKSAPDPEKQAQLLKQSLFKGGK